MIGSDGSDEMMNELPIIPPLRWDAPMLLPFHATANINIPSLAPNQDSDNNSSDDESRVNCNVQ